MANVKYDDWGWHTGGVFPADQPQINGFTHIGMYLVWLIKHDLSNPELHDSRQVSEVNAGTITANDLADAIDGKLTADDMTPEGKAFSDWYYSPEGNPAYLADWANTFRNQPNYTVTDTPEDYARIERVIDARFGQWTEAGRPTTWTLPAGNESRVRRLKVSAAVGVLVGLALAVISILVPQAGARGFLLATGIVVLVASATLYRSAGR